MELLRKFVKERLAPLDAGVELKRKKLRLTNGSELCGTVGDFDVERVNESADELDGGVLFKRRYERFADESDDVDEGD